MYMMVRMMNVETTERRKNNWIGPPRSSCITIQLILMVANIMSIAHMAIAIFSHLFAGIVQTFAGTDIYLPDDTYLITSLVQRHDGPMTISVNLTRDTNQHRPTKPRYITLHLQWGGGPVASTWVERSGAVIVLIAFVLIFTPLTFPNICYLFPDPMITFYASIGIGLVLAIVGILLHRTYTGSEEEDGP